jgi:hypothetical protein
MNYNIILKIKDILAITLNPTWWLMSNKYSKKWDKEFNKLMDNNKFHTHDDKYFYIEIGDKVIWIQNHTYASFTDPGDNYRPSRLTLRRAKRKIELDLKPKDEIRDEKLKKLGIYV